MKYINIVKGGIYIFTKAQNLVLFFTLPFIESVYEISYLDVQIIRHFIL